MTGKKTKVKHKQFQKWHRRNGTLLVFFFGRFSPLLMHGKEKRRINWLSPFFPLPSGRAIPRRSRKKKIFPVVLLGLLFTRNSWKPITRQIDWGSSTLEARQDASLCCPHTKGKDRKELFFTIAVGQKVSWSVNSNSNSFSLFSTRKKVGQWQCVRGPDFARNCCWAEGGGETKILSSLEAPRPIDRHTRSGEKCAHLCFPAQKKCEQKKKIRGMIYILHAEIKYSLPFLRARLNGKISDSAAREGEVLIMRIFRGGEMRNWKRECELFGSFDSSVETIR